KAPDDNGKDQLLFTEGLLKNLPERTCVMKTEDNGQTVYAIVEVPPLDRYLPDGSKARYGGRNEHERALSEKDIAKSNQWTYAKAKELEGKNGLPIAEIDAAINAYMDNGTYRTKKKEKEPEEVQAIETPSKVVNINKKEE